MEDNDLTKRERRELAKEEKRKAQDKQEQNARLKKYLITLVIVGLLGWLGYKAYLYVTEPISEVASAAIEITDSDWVKGDRQGDVTLVEFGDFQCPACVSYYPIVKKLSEEIQTDLKIVYKQYPLTQIHKNAFPAARAAGAAGRQGKFWEMHDVLFEKNSDWVDLGDPRDKFSEFAKEIGLDEQKFQQDYESKEVEESINADQVTGNRIGVNSTPTFYLNAKKVQPKSYDEFKKLIEDEIRGYILE